MKFGKECETPYNVLPQHALLSYQKSHSSELMPEDSDHGVAS